MSNHKPSPASTPVKTNPRIDDAITPRIRASIPITLTGLFIFVIGAKPDLFGWDRSPVVGFVQIAVFLVGLALICLGGYIGLHTLWWGSERTIISYHSCNSERFRMPSAPSIRTTMPTGCPSPPGDGGCCQWSSSRFRSEDEAISRNLSWEESTMR